MMYMSSDFSCFLSLETIDIEVYVEKCMIYSLFLICKFCLRIAHRVFFILCFDYHDRGNCFFLQTRFCFDCFVFFYTSHFYKST